jgi:filamentous hemagglutinin
LPAWFAILAQGLGGAADKFGRKLAYDFVQNNQGTFGAYGWMANQLAPYAQGYDGSTPNGQLAAAAVFGATLATPGGGVSKAKNGAEIIGTVEGRAIRSGDFSIVDWSGYPAGVPKPSGPVNLIPKVEYQGARSAANAENRAIHRTDPSISPQQIHEVQPIRFGGSPTDTGN